MGKSCKYADLAETDYLQKKKGPSVARTPVLQTCRTQDNHEIQTQHTLTKNMVSFVNLI